MLKLATKQESFVELALAAGRRQALSVERVPMVDWWRSDLVLVGPDSGVFSAIAARPGLWAPTVVGIGHPDSADARTWAWAWLTPGPAAEEELSWLLPRVARRGALRRELRRALAHDLRSPLGVVSGYCELLEEELLGPLQPKQQKAVSTIASQSARLLGGLEDLASRLMAPEGPEAGDGEPY